MAKALICFITDVPGHYSAHAIILEKDGTEVCVEMPKDGPSISAFAGSGQAFFLTDDVIVDRVGDRGVIISDELAEAAFAAAATNARLREFDGEVMSAIQEEERRVA